MPQLIMHGPVYHNDYDLTEMFASISYGSPEDPLDHEENKITEPSPALDNYLISHVIPHLQNTLKHSPFLMTDRIDYPHHSIIPAFILKKKDGSEASETEMINLTKLLSQAIDSLKIKHHNKSYQSTLFHPSSSAPAAAATTHAARQQNKRNHH